MASDDFVLSIMKLGLGCFERPTECAGRSGLAFVYLRADGMREKNNLLARGRLDRVRHIGWRFFLRVALGVSDLASPNREDNQPDDGRRRLAKASHVRDCSRDITTSEFQPGREY